MWTAIKTYENSKDSHRTVLTTKSKLCVLDILIVISIEKVAEINRWLK